MEEVQRRLSTLQSQLSQHPIFERLCHHDPLEHLASFARDLTFWVMTFQDLLRLNEERVEDVELRKVAHFLRAGDAGHDKWFLNDLVKLTGYVPDGRWAFGPSHARTRDASWALISEMHLATRDFDRIILMLSLEAAAQAFFPKVAQYVGGPAVERGLVFFSSVHVESEGDHQLTPEQLERMLSRIPHTPSELAATLAMLDRVQDAFARIFDAMEKSAAQEMEEVALRRARTA